jgi:hypothetical protein
MCIVFKTPKKDLFGPTSGIQDLNLLPIDGIVSSNFVQLLRETLYCLANKYGQDPQFPRLAEIPAKAGEKIKTKKFIFFKEFNTDSKSGPNEAAPSDRQVLSQSDKLSSDNAAQDRQPQKSVIEVKPVVMDKSSKPPVRTKNPIEIELDKALREKEELISTIMNLDNSSDKTCTYNR